MGTSRTKRIARLQHLRDLAAEWAARHHAAELEQGIRVWMGADGFDPERLPPALGFALIARFGEGPSLLDRFAATRRGNRLDRQLFRACSESWATVLELAELSLGGEVIAHDMMTGERLRITDASLPLYSDPGDLLLAVLLPLPDGIELEGTALALDVQAFRAVQALTPVDTAGRPASSRAQLVEAVRAVFEASAPPRFVNHDGHPIELILAEVGLPWEELVSTCAAWDDVVQVGEDHLVWQGRAIASLGGPVTLASVVFEEVPRVSTNSRERLDAWLALWEERTGRPLPVVDEQVTHPPSNEHGPELLTDSSMKTGDRDEIMEGWREQLAATWLDEPVPALDGLSPREAAAAGRRAEVWSLLPIQLDHEALVVLRSELGLPPPPLVPEDNWDEDWYEPSEPVDPEWWMSFDEDEQIELALEHHESDACIHEPTPQPTLHAAMHAAIECQLAEDWEPAVTHLRRLVDAGVDRHVAVHALGSVMAERMWAVQHGEAFGNERHAQALAALDPDAWR